MVKISIAEGCGNSPKNLFVQNMSIALTTGDREHIQKNISENARWEIPGEAVLEGPRNILSGVSALESEEIVELQIEHAFSHGAVGAVDGVRILRSGQKIAFCDIFTFKSAGTIIVKSIKSFRVEVP